ncbi:MAG: thiamine phosphate synthase [Methanosphaera sp.]|nr:thiamine phosphate synthase [Methanosphaera sp.]
MNIDYSVYLVTQRYNYTEDEFLNIIEEAILGGVTLLELRERNSNAQDFYDMAHKVKKITDKYDIPFMLNDRLDIALSLDCAGVHLEPGDLSYDVARDILGEDKIIGVSALSYESALQSQQKGADYLSVGAIVKTPTKPDCTVIPRSDLDLIKENITIPRVAVGGLNKDNISEVVHKYNFDGVAVVSSIMYADDPKQTASLFNKLVNE